MFVARVSGLDVGITTCSVKGSDIVAVLDTDDCVVEKYTVQDCIAMSKALTGKGTRSKIEGLSSNIVYPIVIRELLHGVIRCNKHGVFLNRRVALNCELSKDRKKCVYKTTDDKEMFSITFPYFIDSFDAWFEWAQLIQDVGYRLVARLKCYGAGVGFAEYVLVYFFMDMNKRIYIEKVDCRDDSGIYAEINQSARPENQLLGRLALIRGTIM